MAKLDISNNNLCHCGYKQNPHKPSKFCYWDSYVTDNHPEECSECPRAIRMGNNLECTEVKWENCPYWRDYPENLYY